MQRPALTKMPAETSGATVLNYVLLAGVILVGVALRTINIGRDPLWTDEALTLVLAQWPVWDMITKPTDPTPFLYYALHKWLIPQNAGVVGVRSISLAAGILALPAIYIIGRQMFSRAGALLATALLAVSAPLIDYSQEARAYSLLELLVLISVAALLWWFDGHRRSPREGRAALALFVIATVLAGYTHFSAIFWIGPAMLILFALSRSRGPRARADVLAAIAMLILAMIPELIRAAKYAAIDHEFDWLQQATPVHFVEVIRDTLLPIGFGTAATAGLLLPAVIWIAWRSYADWGPLRAWIAARPAAAAVIISLLILPGAAWLFGYVVRPVFVHRTILLAIPGFVLLVVLLIELDRSKFRKIATGAVFIALSVTSIMNFGTVRSKEGWRTVRRVLFEDARPGDVLVVCPIWKFPPLRHAVDRPVDMPVMGLLNGKWQLLQPGLAPDAHWQRRYLNTTIDASSNNVAGPAQATRTWFVLSGCSEADPDSARVIFNEVRSSALVITAEGPISVLRFDPNIASR